MCRKQPDCTPGFVGSACQDCCHCAGEPCRSDVNEGKCQWGCQMGWTGESCTVAREHPDVRYFCINSPEEHVGTYVDIHIHTKGVNYSSIHAVRENGTEAIPWCNSTRVSPFDGSHMTITIPFNDSSVGEMHQGKCAGKEHDDKYEWTLVIQEYDGILLDTDLQVVISCDFNRSETMQRGSQFSGTGPHKSVERVQLSPEETDVALELVDPFSGEPVNQVPIGSPAKLRMRYGYRHGSLVQGVCPHHCFAVSPDGSQSKPLLDVRGCSHEESPVSAFATDVNVSGSISTEWFPVFAFDHADYVEFKCSFDLCLTETSHCEPGCRDDHPHNHHNNHRRRRDAIGDFREESEWSSKVIRLLPPVLTPDQIEQVLTQVSKNQHKTKNDDAETKNRKPTDHPKQPQLGNLKLPHPHARNNTSDEKLTIVASLLSLEALGVLVILVLVLAAVLLGLHFSLSKAIEGLRQEVVLRSRQVEITHAQYHNEVCGEKQPAFI